ncbi:hypothetical protein B0J14DRAFT_285228 [Halenospora varia]|nr:hypothetical protein B0J14DRAFT_285228 [Halenospora varia]
MGIEIFSVESRFGQATRFYFRTKSTSSTPIHLPFWSPSLYKPVYQTLKPKVKNSIILWVEMRPCTREYPPFVRLNIDSVGTKHERVCTWVSNIPNSGTAAEHTLCTSRYRNFLYAIYVQIINPWQPDYTTSTFGEALHQPSFTHFLIKQSSLSINFTRADAIPDLFPVCNHHTIHGIHPAESFRQMNLPLRARYSAASIIYRVETTR